MRAGVLGFEDFNYKNDLGKNNFYLTNFCLISSIILMTNRWVNMEWLFSHHCVSMTISLSLMYTHTHSCNTFSNTPTHTHTHTERERERDNTFSLSNCPFLSLSLSLTHTHSRKGLLNTNLMMAFKVIYRWRRQKPLKIKILLWLFILK